MIIMCRECNNVINFTEEHLKKVKEAFSKMQKEKSIKIKCPICIRPLELKPEMFAQNRTQNYAEHQLNNKKMKFTDYQSHEKENNSKLLMYEFKSVYIPVDSVHEGEKLAELFDISSLQDLGKVGWEIKGVVPRTFSQTFITKLGSDSSQKLANSSICSGNIMGVHILMQRIKE
jgi:hypothetical protein